MDISDRMARKKKERQKEQSKDKDTRKNKRKMLWALKQATKYKNLYIYGTVVSCSQLIRLKVTCQVTVGNSLPIHTWKNLKTFSIGFSKDGIF